MSTNEAMLGQGKQQSRARRVLIGKLDETGEIDLAVPTEKGRITAFAVKRNPAPFPSPESAGPAEPAIFWIRSEKARGVAADLGPVSR